MKEKNIAGLIAIIAIIVVVMFAGCIEEEGLVSTPTPTITPLPTATPTPTPTPTPISETMITKSPSEIALLITDMPDGWRGSGKGNETRYSSSFDKESYGSLNIIECEVAKYSTIDEAKQNFNDLKMEYDDFKLSSVGIGDESFGWEYGIESNVIFRKANIIVDSWYAKEFGTSHIRDAKKYAKIVEKKI